MVKSGKFEVFPKVPGYVIHPVWHQYPVSGLRIDPDHLATASVSDECHWYSRYNFLTNKNIKNSEM